MVEIYKGEELERMLDRLFPLLSNWNNLEMLFGFVLAVLLGLWIGWGWAWKKIGFLGLICAALYAVGVWLEESRSMFWAVIGIGTAALMPVLILSMLAGKLLSVRRNRNMNS